MAAQLARSAGASAQLLAREGSYAQLRLRSGEIRKVHVDCRATIGEVGNEENNLRSIGKAGANRWRGILPTNTVSKNPGSDDFFHLTGQSRWYDKLDEFRPSSQRGLGLLCRQAKASLRRWDAPTTDQNSYDYSLNNFLGGNSVKGHNPPRRHHLSGETFWFSDARMQLVGGIFYSNSTVEAGVTSAGNPYMPPWSWRGGYGVGGASYGGAWIPAPSAHPRWASNFVFGDGHVAALTWDDVVAMDPVHRKTRFQNDP